MLLVAVVTGAVAIWSGLVYLHRERLGIVGLGLATLRTVGVGTLALLVINPGSSYQRPSSSITVLLDASLSMGAPGGQWREALDSARSIAGEHGTILRFASGIASFDTTPPSGGATRLRDALTTAQAMGGAVHVITDGEVDDLATLSPDILNNATIVVLPRDTVPNAALVDVHLPSRVQTTDSIPLDLTVTSWGVEAGRSGRIEVTVGAQTLLAREVQVPAAPGVARRRWWIAAGLLPSGSHVVDIRVVMAGDAIAEDNERRRKIEVSSQPSIVVLADPADWEGRFLATELALVARTTVRGYARVGRDLWVDMTTLERVSAVTVARDARDAGLLVLRGDPAVGAARRRTGQPVWWWPAARDTSSAVAVGDWYVMSSPAASPLAGSLARVSWDSVPPLTGIVTVPGPAAAWTVLLARLGRRGQEQPVVIGLDTAGDRQLTTTGSGLWRWGFRGGLSREAYRSLLAAGIDWLFRSGIQASRSVVTATPTVQRGQDVAFRWVGDSLPDSLRATVTGSDWSEPQTATLRVDAQGNASILLPPGVYQWKIEGVAAAGMTVVEEYSDEFHARAVVASPTVGDRAMTLLEQYTRERWWLFAIAIAALAGEWGWRYRRGMP